MKSSDDAVEYVKVDDIVKYADEGDFDWKEVAKFRTVRAREAEGGERIQTVVKDGTKETDVREAPKGSWIITNPGGEEYIVKAETFERKYEPIPGKAGEFRPKGAPVLAAEVGEDIEFRPPAWGGDVQRLRKGGWLVRDPKNPRDVYGIAKAEFEDTYRETGSRVDEAVAYWAGMLDDAMSEK